MKIGLVCPYSITKGGGVQEIIFAMQAELARRGHEAYIITPQPRDLDPDAAIAKHIIFVGTGTQMSSPIHTTGQVSAGLNEEIERMLDEYKFDILHFHEPGVPMLSRQILARSKAVNIATFHAAFPETLTGRTFAKVVVPYTKSLLKYIDEFVAPSESAAEYVSSLMEHQVAIIPNSIDLEHFAAPKSRNDSKPHKTIFYVGRLEGRKGVKYLLHAYKLLRQQHDDISLVIAGDGVNREQLEMLAQDLELPDVTFLGFISDEEKLKYLRSADLFCAPAVFGESFGIVLIEAMATGLVTVAGNNPGYASVMRGLGAISLVNPKDGPEFARRLSLLLYENDLRKLWRSWAKSQVQQYSHQAVVTSYEELYRAALKKHAHKRSGQHEDVV